MVNGSVDHFSGKSGQIVGLWDRGGAPSPGHGSGGISQQWPTGQLVTLVGKWTNSGFVG